MRQERNETQRWSGQTTLSDSSVLSELLEISQAFSKERDVAKLLALVLEKSCIVTRADAGTIYVVEDGPHGKVLRARESRNHSLAVAFQEYFVPLDASSVAGAVAVSRLALRVPDVYELHAGLPYRFDPTFDQRNGYRSKSMIAIPLIASTHEVIGVVQLINSKRDGGTVLRPHNTDVEVVPFDSRAEELLLALATQASIALENTFLYDEIRHIFDGFVRASVRAIEARDPTTSGHSQRVSQLCLGLASAVSEMRSGTYSKVRFTPKELRELEYAAMLHDFGKIGVREEVLIKAKKLHPKDLALVRMRFDYASKSLEAEYLARMVQALEAGASKDDVLYLREESAKKRTELAELFDFVEASNEPTLMREGDFSRIAAIGEVRFSDLRGIAQPLLAANEVLALQVQKGSLTDAEVFEIRSHVTHTIDFLHQIPWGRTYARIPEIAGAHHEKLNGKGYPHGLSSEQIPLRSKIMSIADIFDALTARDRPYKRAVPVDRALEILNFEVRDGHIDGALMSLFVDARVWEPVLEQV